MLSSTLTVARKCLVTKSYSLHSASLSWSLLALRIGVMGGWSPASEPELGKGDRRGIFGG